MNDVIKYNYIEDSELGYDYYSYVLIPKNSTNGEMFKTLHPEARVVDQNYATTQVVIGLYSLTFDTTWWNEPYR